MKQKVLVVDDEPHIVNFLRLFFERDYEVYEANSGLQGILLAQHLQPDLILLDTQMPKMNGYVTSLKLKNNALTRHIPIIFMASQYRMTDRPLILRSKVDDVIAKPFDPETLKKKVKRLIGGDYREAEYLR